VRSVALQLTGEDGKVIPVEMLLATFLHELAHTITRPECHPEGEVPKVLLALQSHSGSAKHGAPKGFVQLHHPSTFYQNYAALLQVAERLGIYKLPPAPDKFGQKSLRRFDSIDPDAVLRGGLDMGTSERYATALGAAAKPLRLLLSDAGGRRRKPLTLAASDDRSLTRILRDAKRLLNLQRRPTTIATASGQALDEAAVACLPEDTVLVVR
jgi:hypothetical protein